MTKTDENKLIQYYKEWFKDRKTLKRNEIVDRFLEEQKKRTNFFNTIIVNDLKKVVKNAGFELEGEIKLKPIEVTSERYHVEISKNDLIKLYIENKKTITYIANLYGISRDQVYWLMYKYEILVKGSENITKEDVEEAYNNNNIKDAYSLLGISQPALYKLLDKYKIKRKGRRGQEVA